MKVKIMFHGFVLIIFLLLIKRIVINILYTTENNLAKGVIYDINYFSGNHNSATTFIYSITDNKGIKYQDSGDNDTDVYGFSVGDTVIFRKLHDGNSNSIRMIKRNGKQVRNYYGFIDYASPICVIIIILCYIYIPKLLKK
ncbi:hypothetical protein IUY40_00055 [Flavobacterium sp. ALJ2]|uniref:hypothetical protein n=1 Tax=Flavobacterium sp. ALJ2 TaxID=2786960 RepID=UPI00189FBF77|nr:hypothetical protein [Flavobacterium sp. ALJ2]MBF7089942.1 hypothetical protein [Flavobacterium sp. ALJ2]